MAGKRSSPGMFRKLWRDYRKQIIGGMISGIVLAMTAPLLIGIVGWGQGISETVASKFPGKGGGTTA